MSSIESNWIAPLLAAATRFGQIAAISFRLRGFRAAMAARPEISVPF
ncbi:hypothetical protein I6G79_02195 [Burkholderia plantarii]|nr:hypothetical protein [Burkholderia plantarii]